MDSIFIPYGSLNITSGHQIGATLPAFTEGRKKLNAWMAQCKSHDLVEYGRNTFATSGIN
jgi:hypothetical protein